MKTPSMSIKTWFDPMHFSGSICLVSVLNVLLAMMLFATGQAFAWTVSSTFESGTIGSAAKGSTGFDFADVNYAIFSNAMANTGSKSCRMYFPRGFDGTTGAYGSGAGFGEGHEVWFRAYFYFPAGWSWGNAAGKGWDVIKMMRISTTFNHLSIFAENSGQILLSNEISDEQTGFGVNWDVGRWQCMEMYIKLSSTNPIFRIWKDGVLIKEDATHATLPPGGSTDANYLIFSNWNDGSPQNQYAYVDDIILTDVTPSQVDVKGNRMIGPISKSPMQIFTSISVAPSVAAIRQGGSQQFTATARDQSGAAMTVQPVFSWTASGGGVISASGQFTALNSSGGPYTVTASSGGKRGTASIAISSPSAIDRMNKARSSGMSLSAENAISNALQFAVFTDRIGVHNLSIYDTKGQRLLHYSRNFHPGQRVLWRLNEEPKMENGTYFAQLSNGIRKAMCKFTVVR